MPENRAPKTIEPKLILVVDDEPMLRETLRLLLASDGHQVELAENGEKALAMCQNGKYDLVITDYFMAGMNGLKLARLLKDRSPAMPVILVSGMLEELEKREQGLSHFDGVLGKPFSLQQLQQALRKVFPKG